MKENFELELDIVTASGVRKDYHSRKLVPNDIMLVDKDSRNIIARDSIVKRLDYASGTMPEYWIIEIQERNVQEIHRRPSRNS